MQVLHQQSSKYQILAHEIGHYLGMRHDFVPSFYGRTCEGYMDYNPTTHGWSTCNTEDMKAYFNSLTSETFSSCLDPIESNITNNLLF